MKKFNFFSRKKSSSSVPVFSNLTSYDNYNGDGSSREQSEYDDNEDDHNERDREDVEKEYNSSTNSTSPKPVYNLPITVWNGSILWKIPYNGRGLAEKRYVRLKRAPSSGASAIPVRVISRNRSENRIQYIVTPPTLIWSNPEKVDDINNAREIVLSGALDLVEGYESRAFLKSLEANNPLPPEQLCFSIITESRTVDFAAETLEEAQTWKRCLNDIIKMSKTFLPSTKVKAKYSSSQSIPTEKKKLPTPSSVNSDPPRRIPKNTESQSKWKETRDLLFEALRNDDYATVEYFLSIKNISVNQMDSNYQTPLMIACEQNSGHMTRLCLEYGARIDEFPEPFPTALHSAARSRSFECMSILIKTTHHRNNKLETLINRRDSDGNTALHISAYYGDANIIELLVYNGADMSMEDSFGRNALHLSSQYGSRRSLMILLDQGGDNLLDSTDHKGYTPLHYSAEGGHVDCVELLLGAAADPLLRTTEGFTPYDLASQHHHPGVCHLLGQDSEHNYINSEDESIPQSDMNTFVSSLTKEETTARRDEDDERDSSPVLTASQALKLAMAGSITPTNDEEISQREYQLYLLDNGFYTSTLGDRDDPVELPADVPVEDAMQEYFEDLTIPIEEFQYGDNWWQVYHTEDGYIYYFNSTLNQSQWDDPRIVPDRTPTKESICSDHVGQRIPSMKDLSPGSQGSDKKFTRPRQIRSPIRPQRYSPPNTFSPRNTSPRPIVDRSRHQSSTGKMAWTEFSTPPRSPSQSNNQGAIELTPPKYNTFSPNRSSAERAKSLRKNAPFPLSSPPTPLRVAALRAQQDHGKQSPDKRDPWASPSHRRQYNISSPSRGSPQSGGKKTPSKELDSTADEEQRSDTRKKTGSEEFIKNKSFQYRDGAYGCGGNRIEI